MPPRDKWKWLWGTTHAITTTVAISNTYGPTAIQVSEAVAVVSGGPPQQCSEEDCRTIEERREE